MPLTIVGACVVPLIYFFNSYFIGKIFKRFYPQYNSFILTGLGMFTLLGITFVFSMFVFVLPISILGYSIILGILQGLIFLLYLGNWRYSFSFEKTSWKSILICVVILVVIFGLWFLSNNIQYNDLNLEKQNFDSYQDAINTYLTKITSWNSSVFDPAVDPSVLKYSSWNSLNLLWIFLFQISQDTLFDPYHSYFASYSLLFLYALITSLIIVGIFKTQIDTNDYFKMFMIFIITIGTHAILFLLILNPINGLTWIIPILLLLLKLIHDSNLKNFSFRIDFLFSFLLITTYSMTSIFILLIISFIILKTITGLIVKQEHVLSSFMISSIGLMLALTFLIQTISDLWWIVFLLLFITLYGMWFIFIRKPKFKSFVYQLERFLSRNIILISCFVLALIFAASIISSFADGKINFNIDSWIVFSNLLNNPDTTYTQKIIQIIINSIFGGLNIIFFAYCIWVIVISKIFIYLKLKNKFGNKKQIFFNRVFYINKNNFVQKEDYIIIDSKSNAFQMSKQETYLKLIDFEKEYFILLSFLIFIIIWNPLSTNIIAKINIEWNLNVSWLFFLIVSSFLFHNLYLKKTYSKVVLISLSMAIVITLLSTITIYNFG